MRTTTTNSPRFTLLVVINVYLIFLAGVGNWFSGDYCDNENHPCRLAAGLFFVQAIAPPRTPDAAVESVGEWRKRMNITYNYTPKYINPELCRSLSEEECQEDDEAFGEHCAAHRRAAELHYQRRQQNRQRRRLANNSDVDDHHDYKDEEEESLINEEYWQNFYNETYLFDQLHRQLQSRPTVGSFNVLVLLMQFTDHVDRRLPEIYEIQIMLNLRLRKYFRDNSYDKYQPWFDVQDWKLTTNTEAYFANGESGQTEIPFIESFSALLDDLDADPDWDWSPYDIDGDGRLDNLIVLHSGYAAEQGVEDCYGALQPDRIWSHARTGKKWTSADGSMQCRGYMTASALDGTCNTVPAKIGIMTHEYMHTFGLPDLYDLAAIGNGVGAHDIMSYPYGVDNDADFPSMMSGWCRVDAGWTTPVLVETTQTLTVRPSALFDNQIYKIPIQNIDIPGLEEYFLLENRQKVSFDIFYFGAGITIYHVDGDSFGIQPAPGYPGLNGWPENGVHYHVALLQKDQQYHLETKSNRGDPEDLYVVDDVLAPGDGVTFPNTDSYQGGEIRSTGITITILSLEANGDFIVEVNFGPQRAPIKDPPPIVPRTRDPALENATASPYDLWSQGDLLFNKSRTPNPILESDQQEENNNDVTLDNDSSSSPTEFPSVLEDSSSSATTRRESWLVLICILAACTSMGLV